VFTVLKKRRRGEIHERGFTLIELLIVILIVGILAAVAVPLYLGYTQDAKLAEGKALVGSVWTAWQAVAQQNCGVTQSLSGSYSRAGLNSVGATVPPRWTVTPNTATLSSACGQGQYVVGGGPVLVAGTATDNSTLRITLTYDSAQSPPTVIRCQTDGTTNAMFPC
jgi:type IV pilus assembly protein PilA